MKKAQAAKMGADNAQLLAKIPKFVGVFGDLHYIHDFAGHGRVEGWFAAFGGD